MGEADIIKQAHNEAIAALFKVFSDSYGIAQNDADRKAAEDRFRNGILKARKVRDAALELIP